MAKVPEYHTKLPARPPEHDVYHNYDNCSGGKRIESQNWEKGMAGRPRCDECKKLGP